eukprot:5443353-Amphidinium_carterae.1
MAVPVPADPVLARGVLADLCHSFCVDCELLLLKPSKLITVVAMRVLHASSCHSERSGKGIDATIHLM